MKFVLDTHCHTIASGHAYSTMEEVIEQAAKKELELIALTDHSPGMPGSAQLYYFHNLKVLPQKIKGVEILKGIEANIVSKDGNVDVDPMTCKALDIVIASMHPPCISFGTEEENTNAVIRAMENPHINIIGHPDDARYPLDYKKVVKASKENKVLLEVNNSSLNPKGFRQEGRKNVTIMLEECKKLHVPVVIGSDCHISYDVGNFTFASQLIEEINFPSELIGNTSVEKFKKLLRKEW